MSPRLDSAHAVYNCVCSQPLPSFIYCLLLLVGTNYKLKIFAAERHQTGSNFRASTTVVKGGVAGICPDECNYGSGQGTCDLETGTCMCCPGFSGDSCDAANLEKRCSGTATYGIGALQSSSNCYDTVLEGEAVEGEECGYPDTGTWVDACYVQDPEKIADVLTARCIGKYDYTHAFTGVTVNYFNTTTMRCSTKINCGPGSYVINYNKANEYIDRICEVCPEGTFAAGHNLDACTPITDPATCSVVIENATLAHDTVCAREFDILTDGVTWECQQSGQRMCGPVMDPNSYTTRAGPYMPAD